MHALDIAITNLKYTFRDLKSNGIVFILPIVFMFVFALVFNRDFGDVQLKLATVQTENTFYNGFVEQLQEIEDNESEKVFTITEYSDESEAHKSIEDGDNYVFLKPEDEKITLVRDSSNVLANSAEGVIRNIGNTSDSFIQTEDIVDTENHTAFQLQAPGLIVYGILIMIPQVSAGLALLREKNYIFRYFTSRVKSIDIILGFFMSYVVIGLIQTVILFLSAVLFGFESAGNIYQALLFALPTTFFAIGAGLLLGGIATKGEMAQNLGTILSIILGFLSGSFVAGIENLTFDLFGKSISVTTFIPTFYASDGMRKLLLYGQGIGDVINEMIIVSVAGIIILILGMFVFHQRQMKGV